MAQTVLVGLSVLTFLSHLFSVLASPSYSSKSLRADSHCSLVGLSHMPIPESITGTDDCLVLCPLPGLGQPHLNHESESEAWFSKKKLRYPKAKESEMDAEQAEPQVSTTLIHHHSFSITHLRPSYAPALVLNTGNT